MNCTTIEDHFSDYLEDSLPAKRRQSVTDHLRTCPNCQREFDRFQQSVAALQQLPEIEPSAFFDTDLQIQLVLIETMPPPEKVTILDQVVGKFWQLMGSWRWAVSIVFGLCLDRCLFDGYPYWCGSSFVFRKAIRFSGTVSRAERSDY